MKRKAVSSGELFEVAPRGATVRLAFWDRTIPEEIIFSPPLPSLRHGHGLALVDCRAVAGADGSPMGYWVVVHVDSGFSVCNCRTLKAGRAAFDRLTEPGIDWDRQMAEISGDVMEGLARVGEIMKTYGGMNVWIPK